MNLALDHNQALQIDLQDKLNAFLDKDHKLDDASWRFNDNILHVELYAQVISDKAPFFKSNDIRPEVAIKLMLLNLPFTARGYLSVSRILSFLVILFDYMHKKDIAIITREDVSDLFAHYIMYKIDTRGHKTEAPEAKILSA